MDNIKNNLIEILRRFNRKERFFLVGAALGNINFTLGKEFQKALEDKIDAKIYGDVFTAMDYHLDWIDVSLKLWNGSIKIGENFQNLNSQINKNQEDIDLVIAFKSSDKYHMVLIEAKGVTGWTNKQMDSKVKRFREFFGENGKKHKNLIVHFILISPRPPQRINEDWPSWMTTDRKANWMKLTIPDNFMKVTRCDNKGIASQFGKFCIVKETKIIKPD